MPKMKKLGLIDPTRLGDSTYGTEEERKIKKMALYAYLTAEKKKGEDIKEEEIYQPYEQGKFKKKKPGGSSDDDDHIVVVNGIAYLFSLSYNIIHIDNNEYFPYGEFAIYDTKSASPDNVLGEGGFGRVYNVIGILTLTKDGELTLKKADLALKKMKLKDLNGLVKAKVEAEFTSRIPTLEARKLPTIIKNNKNNLLGASYSLMKKLPGHDLDKILRADLLEQKVLTIKERITLTLALLDALDAIHKQGIIHRDIKSENIKVDGDHVDIFDMGLAKNKERDDTSESSGSLEYASYEQFTGSMQKNELSDLFAMGKILSEVWQMPHVTTRWNLKAIEDAALELDEDAVDGDFQTVAEDFAFGDHEMEKVIFDSLKNTFKRYQEGGEFELIIPMVRELATYDTKFHEQSSDLKSELGAEISTLISDAIKNMTKKDQGKRISLDDARKRFNEVKMKIEMKVESENANIPKK